MSATFELKICSWLSVEVVDPSDGEEDDKWRFIVWAEDSDGELMQLGQMRGFHCARQASDAGMAFAEGLLERTLRDIRASDMGKKADEADETWRAEETAWLSRKLQP